MGPNVQEHILDEVDTIRDRSDVHRNTSGTPRVPYDRTDWEAQH